MLLDLAIRNTFRNVRRTLLTVLVIAIGLASLFIYDGLIVGMLGNMVRSGTENFTGHAQLQSAKYIESQDPEWSMANYQALYEKFTTDEGVAAVVRRTYAGGMVSSSQDVGSAMIIGVDPETEKNFSHLARSMVKGQFLQPGKKQVILGDELVESLQVQLGDRIVITVANVKDGEISQELFRLVGVYQMNQKMLDSSGAVIPLKLAQSLLGIGDSVHEIALKFKRLESADSLVDRFNAGGVPEEFTLRSWRKSLPALHSIVEYSKNAIYFVMGILFFIVFFSVMNSMLMSLRERRYEFGVIKAIGTRPTHIFLMIICECGVLALISSIAGILLGVAVVQLMRIYGLDMGGTEISGVQLTEKIIPGYTVRQFSEVPLSMIIITMVSGIYPGISAARIVPQEALRKVL